MSSLNKPGKRRLGRFAVIPASVSTLDKNKSVLKPKGQDVGTRNVDACAASFLSSFTASADTTLLREVEMMEADLEINAGCSKTDQDTSNTNGRVQANLHAWEKAMTEQFEPRMKMPSVGSNKRLHVQTCSVVSEKSKVLQTSSKAFLGVKSVSSKDKSNSPTASPLDKRQKRISNILPVKKVNTRLSKKIVGWSGTSTSQNVTPDGKKKATSKTNKLEISYSPLLTTPDVDSSFCDISMDEESPASAKHVTAHQRNSSSKNTSKSDSKALFVETPKARKDTAARIKTPLKLIKAHEKTQDTERETANVTNHTQRNIWGTTQKGNSRSSEKPNLAKTPNSSSDSESKFSKTNVRQSSENKTGGKRSSPNDCSPKVEKIAKKSNVKVFATSNNKQSIHGSSLNGCSSKPENTARTSNVKTLEMFSKQSIHDFDAGNSKNGAVVGDNSVGSSSRASQVHPSNSQSPANVSVANISVSEDKRQLAQWGLPQPVLDTYKGQGVTTMFEWQAECLLSDQVMDGRNLVFSAPTSAGKTLVAELLVLKRVIETRRKALFILPFVSVAREKMYALQKLYQDAGVRVGGYMGSYSPPGGLANIDVAVCTIEKGNSIVNRLMEEGNLSQLGVVVVDELHMVGDSHRGYLLELMLTKLAFISHRNKCRSLTQDGTTTTTEDSKHHIQLIGMSATLPNLGLLARWLDAALYCTDFRPVPLSEHIKVDNRILDKDLSIQREIPAHLLLAAQGDSDNVIALCLETVTEGNAVLIFCPTKNWCEKLCETIARKFYSLTHASQVNKKNNDADEGDGEPTPQNVWDLHIDRNKLRETVEQLKRCPVGVDAMLGRCLLNGVAYHHAGLTFDERDIIEGAFRQGLLKVLIATSTLSSGVNLPARRVIVRTPMFHGQVIDALTYKQMAGRAGRKGVDTQGESILICKPQEKLKGKNLLQSELPAVQSCLHFDPDEGLSRSLKRAILEVVVSGVASSPAEIRDYVNCTLLSKSLVDTDRQDACSSALMDQCVSFLQDNEFVTINKTTDEDGVEQSGFHPTLLGSAILASSLSPDEGLAVFNELQKARRSFVLDTDLHIIYLVTPMYTSDVSSTVDWYHYHTLWEGLTPADRRVAELVGVSEGFIARAIRGRINGRTELQKRQLAIHLRFYTSLVLDSLVKEVPLMEVAHKFQRNKGQLQSLQQSASTYCGMIAVLCGRLGWHTLEMLVSSFQPRLSSGVQPELVDLVRVSSLSATSARTLYNAGYTTLAVLARAAATDVENVFRTAVPFQSEKQQEGETVWEASERQRARCVWLMGRKGVTELEAAHAIIDEAKEIVRAELGGGAAISWGEEEVDEQEVDEEEVGEVEVDEQEEVVGERKSVLEASTTLEEGNVGIVVNDVNMEGKERLPSPQACSEVLFDACDADVSSRRTIDTEKPTSTTEKVINTVNTRSKHSEKVSNDNEKGLGGLDVLGNVSANSSKNNPNDSSMIQRTPYQSKRQNSIATQGSRSFHSSNKHNTSIMKEASHFRRNSKSFHVSQRRKSYFGQSILTPPPGVTKLSPNPHNSVKSPGTSLMNSIHSDTRDMAPMKNVSKNKVSTPQASFDDSQDTSLNKALDDSTPKRDTLKRGCATQVHGESPQHSMEPRKNQQVDKHCTKVPQQKCNYLSLSSDSKQHIEAHKQNQVSSTLGSPRQQSSYCQLNMTIDDKDNGVSKDTGVSVGTSSDRSPDLAEFSFSASFDLDTQMAKLVNNCGQPSQRGNCKVSTPVCNVSVTKDSRCGNDNGVVNSSMNMPLSSRSDPFFDSFSEALFDACDGDLPSAKRYENNQVLAANQINNRVLVTSASNDEISIQCVSSKAGSSASLKKPPKDVRFENQVSERNCEYKLQSKQHLQDDVEGDGYSENEEEEDEGEASDGSLIAASNFEVLENFDEGMMQDDSFDNSHDSISVLKPCRSTRNQPIHNRSGESQERNSSSNRATTLDPNVDFDQDAAEDEGLLLAALDSSFDNISPFTGLKPQNSTPLSSHTHKGSPFRTTQNESATSATPVSCSNAKQSQRLKKRQITKNATPSSITPITYDPSNPPAPTVIEQSQNCFTDSLSATLMDRIMSECDNMTTPDRATNRTIRQNTQQSKTGIGKENRAVTMPESSPVDVSDPNSANSSRLDGSDCVPPTPPDETKSLVSPFKTSFYSPLKTGRKLDTTGKGTGSDTNKNNSNALDSLEHKISSRPKAPTKCHHKESSPVPTKPCDRTQMSSKNGRNSSKTSITQKSKTPQKAAKHPSFRQKPDECDTASSRAAKPLQKSQPPEAGSPPGPGLDDVILLSQPCSQLTQQSFTIIDVCADRRLFQSFVCEWEAQSRYSLALACERMPQANRRTSGPACAIGQRFIKKKAAPAQTEDKSHMTGMPIPDSQQMLVGLAVSWDARDVYFMSLMPDGYIADCDPDDTLSEPDLDPSLSQDERINTFVRLLHTTSAKDNKSPRVTVYDAKAVYITLAKTLGVCLPDCEDPRVADWLRAPSAKLKNLHHMVAAFCPEELPLLDTVGGASSYGSIGLQQCKVQVGIGANSGASGRLRACTESVLARILMCRHYHAKLAEEDLLQAFTDVEMPSLITLARMELNGFGVSESEIESQKVLMTTKLTLLEERAYALAGRVFSLTSTDDISKVMYSELRLPINGDPTLAPQLPGGKVQGRRGRSTGVRGGTSKEILEKLSKFHALPAIILEWRRISSALTKSLFALQNTARPCLKLNMPRVFGDCQIFTATGRVSMAEPNIQNIPKDFAIQLPGNTDENFTSGHQGKVSDSVITSPVSMRTMFVPFQGAVLVAADYSQLELRIIAHLCGETKLTALLNRKDGDVFKMIASQMHSVAVEEVDAAQRQQAKQVCYGMLYGIGPKALGEQLGVDENEAGAFVEMFKFRFPGIRKYLRETVEFCQKNGYVKTMFNRRRFLPAIKHSNPHARAQAERQAVNTTVQGSAADLVKLAMVDIDRKLQLMFPDTKYSHSQRNIKDTGEPYSSSPRGAYLVLQLHDELIYETHMDCLPQVAALIKSSMEASASISVTLPVKVKVGPSWGQLQDYDVA